MADATYIDEAVEALRTIGLFEEAALVERVTDVPSRRRLLAITSDRVGAALRVARATSPGTADAVGRALNRVSRALASVGGAL